MLPMHKLWRPSEALFWMKLKSKDASIYLTQKAQTTYFGPDEFWWILDQHTCKRNWPTKASRWSSSQKESCGEIQKIGNRVNDLLQHCNAKTFPLMSSSRNIGRPQNTTVLSYIYVVSIDQFVETNLPFVICSPAFDTHWRWPRYHARHELVHGNEAGLRWERSHPRGVLPYISCKDIQTDSTVLQSLQLDYVIRWKTTSSMNAFEFIHF